MPGAECIIFAVTVWVKRLGLGSMPAICQPFPCLSLLIPNSIYKLFISQMTRWGSLPPPSRKELDLWPGIPDIPPPLSFSPSLWAPCSGGSGRPGSGQFPSPQLPTLDQPLGGWSYCLFSFLGAYRGVRPPQAEKPASCPASLDLVF